MNLWISSTNTIVLTPNCLFFSASSMTFLISLIPEVTAEKVINSDFVSLAIILASVVFPTPGGPQKIIEEILSLSIIRLSNLFSPIKCVCPTTSLSFLGLIRDARGSFIGFSNKDACSIVPLLFYLLF